MRELMMSTSSASFTLLKQKYLAKKEQQQLQGVEKEGGVNGGV